MSKAVLFALHIDSPSSYRFGNVNDTDLLNFRLCEGWYDHGRAERGSQNSQTKKVFKYGGGVDFRKMEAFFLVSKRTLEWVVGGKCLPIILLLDVKG